MTILALILWWLLGLSGFIFWQTRHSDVSLEDLLFGATCVSILGPFTFLVGWDIHGDPIPSIVIFKKRGSK